MARLTVDGLEDLIEDMKAIVELPDEVALKMLGAEADVIEKAQKSQICSLGLVDSGQLAGSIQRTGKLQFSRGERVMHIYPQGVRQNGVRNAEVGFIHEYGAARRHIRASRWMQKANENAADAAVERASEVYDAFLKSNNL